MSLTEAMASIFMMQRHQSSMLILSIWTRFISSHAMTKEKQLISTAQWPNKSLWISMRLWSMQKKPLSTLLKKKSILKAVCRLRSWLNEGLKLCSMVLWSQLDLNILMITKDLVMGSSRHLTRWFSFAKTMRLAVSTILLVFKLISSGESKSASSKWFQV